jgi:hypothetical protein
MARLSYKITDVEFLEASREASKIEFEIPNDLDIFEYRNICIRLAAAMGYHSNSITKAFPPTAEDELDINTINDLLNDIS